MKALFLISAITLSTGIWADVSEKKVDHYHHSLSPKFIYRKHEEGGYSYKVSGVGFEYRYHQNQGINFIGSLSSNISESKPLVEEEFHLSYYFPVDESFAIYPLVAYRMGIHRMDKNDQSEYFINKGISYLGAGFQAKMPFDFRVYGEIMGFKDVCNIAMVNVSVNDNFYGKRYANPKGLRARLGIQYHVWDYISFNLEGNYAKALPKDYWEAGAQLAANIGF